METVFLLMWGADVAAGLKVLAISVAVAYGFAMFMASMFAYVEEKPAGQIFLLRKWWVVALVVGLAVLMPSKDTLYLAAAGKTAQIGATAVAESPLGKKTVDALGAVLDRVIREADEKK